MMVMYSLVFIGVMVVIDFLFLLLTEITYGFTWTRV